MANYVGTRMRNEIIIDKIYTVHYFEYAKGFTFTGEKHDFWEFVYIDKGEAVATVEDSNIQLCHGDIIFHKPNEWHNISTSGATNSVIVTFSTRSRSMKFFENKVLKIGNIQKKLISKIIAERINSFEGPLGDPYTESLVRKKNSPVGSEQLIKQYITELLILLMRNDDTIQVSSLKSHITDTTFDEITAFMNKNINRSLTLSEIASFANMSISSVREIFTVNTGKGVIDYFIDMKIEYAKKYIRDGNYNLTQIAELLGYSSPHYFSRQFKQKTSMAPIEYSKSIKSLVKEGL